jgi:hypothetical protein
LPNSYSDPDMVFKSMKITPDHKVALIESISKKMAQQPIKLRATFELHCFTYEGIDAIKAALIRTKKEINDDQFTIDVSTPNPSHFCFSLKLLLHPITNVRPRPLRRIRESKKSMKPLS